MQQFAKILAFMLLMATQSFAACHVVTPSGSGSQTGADWNNAYANLPAPLTSGDTYYLSDGSYGLFALGVSSGNSRTTIKKATASDHCTDAGWSTATMGGSQAVFTRINFSTTGNANNVTFDGNGASTGAGCGKINGSSPSDCGIKVDDSACTGACDSPILMSVYQGAAVTGAVFRYMEWSGNGSSDTGNSQEDNFLYVPQTTGPSSFTLQHIYGHDAGCVYWQDYGGPTYLVEYSYFWGNWSNPNQCHGQLTYDHGSVNSIFRYNVVRDIEGTAVFTWDDGSRTDHWYGYGNVFWYSNGGQGVRGQNGTSNGLLACENPGSVCTSIYFYNNTIVNWNYTNGIFADNPGGSYTWENNLIYQASENPGGGPANPGGINFVMNGSTLNEDYNSFLNSGSAGKGSHDVSAAISASPFVNWTAGNFHLVSENSEWSRGLQLLASLPLGCSSGLNCFNSDPDGVLHGADATWERGAFEFNNGNAVLHLPSPPGSLRVAGVR